MYSKTDELFIVTAKGGYIPQLKMCGPIVNPIKITAGECYGIIVSGTPICEYDPKTRNSVLLTIDNLYNDTKFGKKIADVSAPVSPVSQISNTTNVFTGVPLQDTTGNEEKPESDVTDEEVVDSEESVTSDNTLEEILDDEKPESETVINAASDTLDDAQEASEDKVYEEKTLTSKKICRDILDKRGIEYKENETFINLKTLVIDSNAKA